MAAVSVGCSVVRACPANAIGMYYAEVFVFTTQPSWRNYYYFLLAVSVLSRCQHQLSFGCGRCVYSAVFVQVCAQRQRGGLGRATSTRHALVSSALQCVSLPRVHGPWCAVPADRTCACAVRTDMGNPLRGYGVLYHRPMALWNNGSVHGSRTIIISFAPVLIKPGSQYVALPCHATRCGVRIF